MPKLKVSDEEQRDRIVRACIAGNQEREGISNKVLAKRLCIAESTLSRKKNHPGSFALDAMRIVAKVLKFTPFQASSILLRRELTAVEIKDFILL